MDTRMHAHHWKATVISAAMLVIAGVTGAVPAGAQEVGAGPTAGTEVVYRGTAEGRIGEPVRVSVRVPRRLSLRGVVGTVDLPESRPFNGAVSLRLTFDGAAVTARVSGTQGLRSSTLSGTVEDGTCRLANPEGTSVWTGRCDARGFSGTFRSDAASGRAISGRFETLAERTIDPATARTSTSATSQERGRRQSRPAAAPATPPALPEMSADLRGRIAAMFGISPASFDAKPASRSGYLTLEEYADGRRQREWLLYFLCMREAEPGCLENESYAHTRIAIHEPARNKLYVASRQDTTAQWCREAPSKVCTRSTAAGAWVRPGPAIDYEWTLQVLAIANRRADTHALLARCLRVNDAQRSWVVETRDGYGAVVDSRVETQGWLELRNTCGEPLHMEMAACSFFLWYEGPFTIYPGSTRRLPVNAARCQMYALIGLPPF